MARLGLRTQAARNGVQKAAHQGEVRVAGMQLFFDPVDGFDQIFLVAAGKGHARDGILYGDQRLMYCDLLRPIHAAKSEPVWAAPQVLQIRQPRRLHGGAA
jgi:hypothetical protein